MGRPPPCGVARAGNRAHPHQRARAGAPDGRDLPWQAP
uniref:Uncharacterized protein n=1 Tax=Mycolicibacterium phage phi1_186018 TaxID=3236641 RepID=A0AB39AKQ7_9CAUD